MDKRDKSIVFGSLVLGAVIAIGMLAVRRRRKSKSKLPRSSRWRSIGTLEKILIFPMKSGAFHEINEAECYELGPAEVAKPGLFQLKDRAFTVYRSDTKEIMVCMTFPIMVSIKIQSFSENSVLFKCKDKLDLVVTIPTASEDNLTSIKVKMWTEEIMDCVDCGDEISDWLTEVIKGDKNANGKLRLGCWNLPATWKNGSDEDYNNRGSFQNYTSYMMMSSSSLEDLESKVPECALNFKQFRPNFLINTTLDPFFEDSWTWVKIGEEAIFTKKEDCSRCVQINIDPETSKFHPKQEPLKTLTKYRKGPTGKGPLMGILLGLYRSGRVKQGDPVYIIE